MMNQRIHVLLPLTMAKTKSCQPQQAAANLRRERRERAQWSKKSMYLQKAAPISKPKVKEIRGIIYFFPPLHFN